MNIQFIDVQDLKNIEAVLHIKATEVPLNTIRVEFLANPGATHTQFGYQARLTQSQLRGHMITPISLNTINPIKDLVECLNKAGYDIQSVVEFEGQYYLGTNVIKPFN